MEGHGWFSVPSIWKIHTTTKKTRDLTPFILTLVCEFLASKVSEQIIKIPRNNFSLD